MRLVPLSPNLTTVQLMGGLFEAQGQVLLDLRGPWEDDDDDSDYSDEGQTAINSVHLFGNVVDVPGLPDHGLDRR